MREPDLGPDVLVLEDDRLVRQSLTETLEHAGYRVIGAANGVEGLARLAELRPRMILLDMVMPEMDGFEFLGRLRANSVWSTIPVLIISSVGEALRQSMDRRGSDVLGIFGIVPKPIDTTTLIELVSLTLSSPMASGNAISQTEPGAGPAAAPAPK